ncbi:unnamed protein product [Thelazia callipaeda]|uniref:Uncharacterized protein n=1 Tax=Thelazia callipaeda TaxID=103827 RepID=A0A158RCW5_THECL|nr:unnamed protein product [Thelazia callipaeda]
MFKNLFRPRRSNKENENQHERREVERHANEFERNSYTSKSLKNSREKRSYHVGNQNRRGTAGIGLDESVPSATASYHGISHRKYPRGTQSCYDSINESFDRFSNNNRSFVALNHPKYRELRAELRVTNERKNYYKDLYKRERQDRIRDRELRDLVEKKLMDDLKRKNMECSSNLLRIKALEKKLQLHQTSFPPTIRESPFRVPHFCTPSTSNTASTMAGAGEALSSTSELFGIQAAYLTNPLANEAGTAALVNLPINCDEMPDETKVFRQPDDFTVELARNTSKIKRKSVDHCDGGSNQDEISSNSLHLAVDSKEYCNGTILEEDPQSDNGYGTTSECASERVRGIHRTHGSYDASSST